MPSEIFPQRCGKLGKGCADGSAELPPHPRPLPRGERGVPRPSIWAAIRCWSNCPAGDLPRRYRAGRLPAAETCLLLVGRGSRDAKATAEMHEFARLRGGIGRRSDAWKSLSWRWPSRRSTDMLTELAPTPLPADRRPAAPACFTASCWRACKAGRRPCAAQNRQSKNGSSRRFWPTT